MPPDDDVERSSDRSAEAGNESTVASMARDAQEKPEDLKEQERQHGDLRKLGATASSADLPHLDLALYFDGELDTTSERSEAPEGPDTPTDSGNGSDSGRDTRWDGQVSRDADGRVDNIKYPDGKTITVTYDEVGDSKGQRTWPDGSITPTDKNNASLIETNDGTSWKKEGRTWQKYDEHGEKAGAAFEGDIKVSAAGTIMFVRPDGSHAYEKQTNGTGVGRDVNGHVIEVAYADGTVNEISPDGNEIHTQKGPTWKKESDGTWHKYDETGKPGESWDGDVKVTSGGDIEFNRKDGSHSHVTRPDGTATEYKSDGSSITKNPDGQPTEIRYPDGHSARVEYDSQGKEQHIVDSNGLSYDRDGEGWHIHGKDGQVDLNVDKVTVLPNGDIERKTGNEVNVLHADSRVSYTNVDAAGRSYGSEKDAKGNLTEISYPDGHKNTIEREENGHEIAIHTAEGSVCKKDAASNTWKMYDANNNLTAECDEMKVLPNGDIERRSGNEVFAKHADGSSTLACTDALGKSYGYEKDAQGHITEIKYPNGRNANVEYDASGKELRIVDSEGTQYEKDGDGWHITNKDKQVDVKVGEIKVLPNGDIERKTGNETNVIHNDGRVSYSNVDDSGKPYGYEKDGQGHLTEARYPDGHKNTIDHDASGQQTAVHTGDGSVYRRDPESNDWKLYDANNKVTDQCDELKALPNGDIERRSGNEVFVRHADGTGTFSALDASGKTYGCEKDARGNVTETTHPDGRKNKIEYDQDGHLVAIHTYDGSVCKKDPVSNKWQLRDANSNLLDEADEMKVSPNGDIERRTGREVDVRHLNGSRSYTTVDASGKSYGCEIDAQDRVTETTHPNGRKNKIDYDPDGNVTAIHTHDGSVCKKDPVSNKWQLRDANNNLLDEADEMKVLANGDIERRNGSEVDVRHLDGKRSYTNVDASGKPYGFESDAQERPTKIVDADNGSTYVYYDYDGKLSSISNPDGSYLEKTSDGWVEKNPGLGTIGKPIKEEIEVASNGDIIHRANDGSSTEVRHADGTGSYASVDGAGKPYSYEKNLPNRITEISYPDGHKSSIEYDQNGHETAIHTGNGSVYRRGEVDPTDPTAGRAWKQYDANNKLVGQCDEVRVERNGDIRRRTGREINTMHPDGTSSSSAVDASGKAYGYETNAQGRVSDITYPSGTKIGVEYDAGGKEQRLINANGSRYEREGGAWHLYDKDNNKVEDLDDVKVLPNGEIELTKGNEIGRKHADGTYSHELKDAQGKSYGFDRDANGHVTEVTHPNGRTSKMDYDKEGNLVAIHTNDGSVCKLEPDQQGHTWRMYDADNKVIDSCDEMKVTPQGDIERRRGSEHQVRYLDGASSYENVDASGKAYGYETNAQGRVTDITYPSGTKLEIEYDAGGKEQRVVNANGSRYEKEGGAWHLYDKDHNKVEDLDDVKVLPNGEIELTKGNETGRKHADGTYSHELRDAQGKPYGFDRDANGHVTEVTHPNGRTSKMDYDTDGNLVAIHTHDGSVCKLEPDQQGHTWRMYDANNNVIDSCDEMKVTPQGDIERRRGSEQNVMRLDGTRSYANVDASGKSYGYEMDSQGHVTEISYPDGHKNTIDFDENGNETAIHTADGSVCKKDPASNTWKMYDANNKLIDQCDEMRVLPNGDITRRSGEDVFTKHADGTASRTGESSAGDTPDVPAGDGSMGAAGDRSKDSGLAIMEKPMVGKDPDTGEIKQFQTPEGRLQNYARSGDKWVDLSKPGAKPGQGMIEAVDVGTDLSKLDNLTDARKKDLRQDLADIDKLPKEQRETVYKNLERIASNSETSGDKINLDPQQKRELVASLAHQIAHPESVMQGNKMSCALANVEETMAKTHPDVYADMVAKLALDGRYTTAGNPPKTVETQLDNEGQLLGKTDAYGQRSLTSELFQNAAANIGLPPGDTYKSYPPYAQELFPPPEGVTRASDLGERVYHSDGRPPDKFGDFKAEREVDVLNQLAPDDKYGAVAVGPDGKMNLEDALKRNGPPLNVGIALDKDYAQVGASGDKGAYQGQYHAVNITHIETDTNGFKKVYFENPAGGPDHSWPNGKGVPLEDFEKAMNAGKTDMKAIVKGAGDGVTVTKN